MFETLLSVFRCRLAYFAEYLPDYAFKILPLQMPIICIRNNHSIAIKNVSVRIQNNTCKLNNEFLCVSHCCAMERHINEVCKTCPFYIN